MVIKEDQLQWFTSFLINSLGRGVDAQPNYELANELHKQIIRKCKRPRDSSSLRDTISGVDQADM